MQTLPSENLCYVYYTLGSDSTTNTMALNGTNIISASTGTGFSFTFGDTINRTDHFTTSPARETEIRSVY